MQQIIKKFQPVCRMSLIILAAFIFGCNNEPAKTEETKAAPAPAPVEKMTEKPVTKDTLPPVDSNASSRPEPRKTRL